MKDAQLGFSLGLQTKMDEGKVNEELDELIQKKIKKG